LLGRFKPGVVWDAVEEAAGGGAPDEGCRERK